uniref:Uncharacterized protein n=1 Tax=Anguilla anguilla TaxID=7936 RepID=A0A0E9SLA6_ANGAN
MFLPMFGFPCAFGLLDVLWYLCFVHLLCVFYFFFETCCKF